MACRDSNAGCQEETDIQNPWSHESSEFRWGCPGDHLPVPVRRKCPSVSRVLKGWRRTCIFDVGESTSVPFWSYTIKGGEGLSRIGLGATDLGSSTSDLGAGWVWRSRS